MRLPRLVWSILLGVVFALSLYGNWLTDVFPSDSRRILLLTFLAGLAGVMGYFALLELWLVPQWARVPRAERWRILLWGGLVGGVLMFAGTKAWAEPSRYLFFFLPVQHLEVVAQSDDRVEILWISTSLGDVSYDTVQLKGWERRGDHLVLNDPVNNSVRWSGKTGADTLVLFAKSPQGGAVTVSWNGEVETVDLRSEAAGTFAHRRQLDVQFIASPVGLQALAFLNFWAAGAALYLLFLKKRSELDGYIKGGQSAAPLKREYGWLTLIMVAALLLRVFNLEILYPYVDEYSHLIAAGNLLRGDDLLNIYERGFFPVTLPVSVSYRVFGAHLWAARLPGVLFNVLGLIPLYLITRRINRPVAWLACVLYATSPYLIAFARNIREYAYYPFFFYGVIYFMLVFLQGFPERFAALRDWKKLKWKHAGIVVFLALLAGYVLVADFHSTFKLILIAYGILAIFIFMRFDLQNWQNWLLFGAGIIFVVAILMQFSNIKRLFTLPGLDLRVFEYFFLNPPQQWYFDRWLIVPALAVIIAFYVAFVLRHVNFIPGFLWGLFIGYVLFFAGFFRTTGFNMHPRFVLSVQVWFIPILAMGGYGLWLFVRVFLKDRWKLTVFVASILFLSSFNVLQVFLPTFFRDEVNPVTRLIHDDLEAADVYLLANASRDDILVGTVYPRYVQWREVSRFVEIHPYTNRKLEQTNQDAHAYISALIEAHPSGWIVIDDLRLELMPPGLPGTQAVMDGKTVEYVGKFMSQHIWRWGVK